uniref:Uncharacterized protein n=1 Tax=Rhizophora mucronata TaxID=61149 RepID=A0A2P2NLJ1_RHIMU
MRCLKISRSAGNPFRSRKHFHFCALWWGQN